MLSHVAEAHEARHCRDHTVVTPLWTTICNEAYRIYSSKNRNRRRTLRTMQCQSQSIPVQRLRTEALSQLVRTLPGLQVEGARKEPPTEDLVSECR